MPDERLAQAYAVGALLAMDGADDRAVPLRWFRAADGLIGRLPGTGNPLLRLVGPLAEVYRANEGGGDPLAVAALDAAVDDAHPWVGATARLIRGHLGLNFGERHAAAEADFHAALAAYEGLGERWGTSFTLVSLSTLAGWRGDFEAAVAYRERAVALATELGGPEGMAQFTAQLAREVWLLGDRDRAQALLADARRVADRAGHGEALLLIDYLAGDLARLEGRTADAAELLDRAAARVAEARRGVAPQFRAMVATARGHLAAQAGDLPEARRQHAGALAAARTARDSPVVALALIGLADLALRDGEPVRAAELLGAARSVRGVPDWSVVDDARVTGAARSELGPARFDAAFERGRRTPGAITPA